jgi:prophage tail gpP-like protein
MPSATNDSRVTVLVAGTEYSDIKSYTIDSNVLTLADTFEFQLANLDGAHSGDINEGDPVAVYIEDPAVNSGSRNLILMGLVTGIDLVSDTSGGTTMTIQGADLGWHLVNNCGPLFKTLMGLTFQKFLDAVIDSTWGFRLPSRTDNDTNRRLNQGRAAIASARSAVDVFIPPVCFEAGQQIGDTLIQYAQRAHQLANVSSDGYLQIWTPRYDTPAAFTLHYHKSTEPERRLNNVKAPIRISRNIDGLYTKVICVGTVAVPSVMPSPDNPHAGTFRGEWSDETALPFNRLFTFSDGDALTPERAANRAKWKANRGKFDSWIAQYTAIGHSAGGTLFAPDTMCGVNDTVHGVHGSYYISARRFVRSMTGGTTTVLELRRPNLLSA